jgi:hypothetical protein
MATLHERKHYREAIMQTLYEAVEGNRLLGITGVKLCHDLAMPAEDLAAACTYLAVEGLIEVDWTRRKHTRDGHTDAQGDPAHGGRGGSGLTRRGGASRGLGFLRGGGAVARCARHVEEGCGRRTVEVPRASRTPAATPGRPWRETNPGPSEWSVRRRVGIMSAAVEASSRTFIMAAVVPRALTGLSPCQGKA